MIRCQKILLAFMLLITVAACDRDVPDAPISPAVETAISVTVVIESDGGDKQSHVLDELSADSTVADAMRAIKTTEVQFRGDGTMAFVDSIDGLRTGGGKGWLYYINDQWANAGIGTQRLSDGDVVRWTYGSFDAH